MKALSIAHLVGCVGLLAGSSLIAQTAHAEVCGGAAFSAQLPKEADWRKDRTNPSQSGEFAATSAAREKQIERTIVGMEDFILNFKGDYGTGDIPWMRFIPAEGTDFSYITQSNGLNGSITRVAVRNAGNPPVIRGSLLLPVSGHNGNDNARKWAKTDHYVVNIDTNRKNTPSTHHSYGHDNKMKALFGDAKSLDLVTVQDVEIALIPNVPVVVTYYRKGSAGVEGYIEGRVMEFIWDGTTASGVAAPAAAPVVAPTQPRQAVAPVQVAPVAAPQAAPAVAPAPKAVTPNPAPAPKKGFFQRLFGG
jgi:hypothetical protein